MLGIHSSKLLTAHHTYMLSSLLHFLNPLVYLAYLSIFCLRTAIQTHPHHAY
ncbi:hypothetical protein E2C01_078935 [Portunus trituberculatus]|uniref:Uncharacterized protein n=1 Tax=Portunus trituberculatus TaxID=210409 RepID=A0A5B7IRG1_PORTR|nr:hypothetical protein [Portunus trituberculatus]